MILLATERGCNCQKCQPAFAVMTASQSSRKRKLGRFDSGLAFHGKSEKVGVGLKTKLSHEFALKGYTSGRKIQRFRNLFHGFPFSEGLHDFPLTRCETFGLASAVRIANENPQFLEQSARPEKRVAWRTFCSLEGCGFDAACSYTP